MEKGFSRVEPGTFMVGSPQTETPECRGMYSERQVQVTLTYAYEIAKTETTQKIWEAMGFPNYSCLTRGPEYPVNCISYYDALAFCNRLSEYAGLETCYDLSSCENEPSTGCTQSTLDIDGVECETSIQEYDKAYTCDPTQVRKYKKMFECKGYRLPTRPEWEQAARAGTNAATYAGDIPNPESSSECIAVEVLEPIAWYCYNSNPSGQIDPLDWTNEQVHPVGQKEPNNWDLYDMLGNIGEWTDSVHTGFGLAYAETGLEELEPQPLTDPMGAQFDGPFNQVHLRGNHAFDIGCRVRIADLLGKSAYARDWVSGFRPARTLP